MEDTNKPTEIIDGLTPKQNAFVEAYLANGCNGTQAVFTAYDTDNEGTAGGMASELLRNPKITKALRAKQDDYLSSLGIDKAHIFKILAQRILKGGDRESNDAIRIWAKLTGAYEPEQKQILEVREKILEPINE